MVLVIDNYDSFTYNLVQYLEEFERVKVVRNDKISLAEIENIDPGQIVISPGPGRPEAAGISEKVVENFKDKYPILGVCLGHQCIGHVFGCRIVKANEIFHGKTSLIYSQNKDQQRGIFSGIQNYFTATRYHSLIIEPESISSELNVIATTEKDEIMAIVHETYPVYGVQFHPESILTDGGKKILENFIKIEGE